MKINARPVTVVFFALFLIAVVAAIIVPYFNLDEWVGDVPNGAVPILSEVAGEPGQTASNTIELTGLGVALVFGNRLYYGAEGDQVCIEPDGLNSPRFELFIDAATFSLGFDILVNGQVEVGGYDTSGAYLGYSVETLTGTTEFRGYIVDGLSEEFYVLGYDPNIVICLGPFYLVPDSDDDGVAGDGDCDEVNNDGDGYSVCSDCDDGSAAVYPGASEIPDNGIDENCDGHDEVSPTPEPSVTPTPVEISPTPEPVTPTMVPEVSPTPEPEASLTPRPEVTPTPWPVESPTPVVEQSPTPEPGSPTPASTPESTPEEPTSTPPVEVTPTPEATQPPEISPTPSGEDDDGGDGTTTATPLAAEESTTPGASIEIADEGSEGCAVACSTSGGSAPSAGHLTLALTVAGVIWLGRRR